MNSGVDALGADAQVFDRSSLYLTRPFCLCNVIGKFHHHRTSDNDAMAALSRRFKGPESQ